MQINAQVVPCNVEYSDDFCSIASAAKHRVYQHCSILSRADYRLRCLPNYPHKLRPTSGHCRHIDALKQASFQISVVPTL